MSIKEFMLSDAADTARTQLQAMVDDPQYNTSYRCIDDAEFIAKNMAYIGSHPNMEPSHYISNLKLKLKSVA